MIEELVSGGNGTKDLSIISPNTLTCAIKTTIDNEAIPYVSSFSFYNKVLDSINYNYNPVIMINVKLISNYMFVWRYKEY